jgi:hypothetical protein
MDLKQLEKAFFNGTILEYLFEDNQWLPAMASHYQGDSSRLPNIAIRLLQDPLGRAEIISPSADDLETRLRLKN